MTNDNEHPGRWITNFVLTFPKPNRVTWDDVINQRVDLRDVRELVRDLDDHILQLERERDEQQLRADEYHEHLIDTADALRVSREEIAALKAENSELKARVAELEKEVEELNGAHWNSLSLADRKALIKDAGK